ncbi:MAG: hypothetical protein KDD04_03430 [Sinomicrobium sp.]|nr:hypothetical protein [Sinomicrobium sp.]
MMFLYFDPGLGALILQFLIAVVAAVTLFYRNVMAKIKSIFGFGKSRKDLFDDLDADRKTQESGEGT